MKNWIFIFALLLSACAQMTNSGGAAQSVSTIDYKSKLYRTSCSGLVDSWADCFARARKTCTDGYEEIGRSENPVGVERRLTFQCKK